ncbi:MAG TPA: DUF3536 domain-containing protein [Thermoanaerobaculia bacterium]
MPRHVCVHGHFYQPPRENPWLEAVEVQDSAYPYHDWNERITAECYAPNAASRILGGDGAIERIVDNYAQISFDFGPTLLSWLEAHRPEVYRAVLDADRKSRERFSGHGSALAQPYNHMILPLANRRDKETQIVWGLRDFAHRFGRDAEGVWLPEAAVDVESLDLLARHGVLFTVLEPHQARRLPVDGEAEAPLDPTVSYYAVLPSGRRIALFFYDGAISRAIAFEGLLGSGERLAARLLAAFPEEQGDDRLVHVATDGETYGHHHRRGEMALSYALHQIETRGWARLTNYGEYLEAHPPERAVEIVESTSWSCLHGVDRWREDCGCRTGGPAEWNQAWRAPLKSALDALRDRLAPLYEQKAAELLPDPWAARDDYIDVVLDRGEESVERFFARHAKEPLPPGPRRSEALELLEMQRHAMLMYTSCGWFFSDLGGIETEQVLRYAGRAAEIADRRFGAAVEEDLLRRLAWAKSNDPDVGSGRDLYLAAVGRSAVDLRQVAAHYALSSLFEEYPREAEIHCYSVVREHAFGFRDGRRRLTVGKIRITSRITGRSLELLYGAVHRGDPQLAAGVKAADEAAPGEYERLVAALGAVTDGDFERAEGLLRSAFGALTSTLSSLFRDEQRRILSLVLATSLREAEDELRELFRHHAPLMRSLHRAGAPLPRAFRATAEFVLNGDLRRALADPEADPEELRRKLDETAAVGVELDAYGLGYELERTTLHLLERLRAEPLAPGLVQRTAALVALARTAPFPVDLWRAQDLCYEMSRDEYPEIEQRAKAGEAAAVEWTEAFRQLAEGLAVRVG